MPVPNVAIAGAGPMHRLKSLLAAACRPALVSRAGVACCARRCACSRGRSPMPDAEILFNLARTQAMPAAICTISPQRHAEVRQGSESDPPGFVGAPSWRWGNGRALPAAPALELLQDGQRLASSTRAGPFPRTHCAVPWQAAQLPPARTCQRAPHVSHAFAGGVCRSRCCGRPSARAQPVLRLESWAHRSGAGRRRRPRVGGGRAGCSGVVVQRHAGCASVAGPGVGAPS